MSSHGLIAFFASDIEGSTRLWQATPDSMSRALLRHDELLHGTIQAHGGRVFKTVGDGVFALFPLGRDAAAAAIAAQRILAGETWPTDRPIRVRMALHTGPAEERDGDFFGPTLNRLARVLAIGHGGQILLSEVAASLLRDAMPPETALRDMGRHRLKDIDGIEAVAMLTHPDLGAEFPPLRSLDARPNNLPRSLTSFVGRERETREVLDLLRAAPLATLTGAGGTGKTRLALGVAGEVAADFPDGVWLVELAALTDPALVPQAIASTMGVRDEGHPTESLLNALRDRTTLLVLDNCEHLLDACADIVGRILRAAPGAKILATSREAMNLPGEAVFRVPTLSVGPLRVTTARAALEHDAIRLLVDRIRLVDSRFELTDRLAGTAAAICRRLDGIPLAIELAASRARALPLEKIAALLDDRFRLLTAGSRAALPRQQTLRATIEWSHGLLEPTERTLLRRVSAFAGGWTLESAEAVCPESRSAGADLDEGGLEEWEVMDGLMRLVEKSLVVYDFDTDVEGGGEQARYRLLESVREYAAERLGSNPEETRTIRERHAEHYAALVISSEEGLQGPDQARWLEILEREHDNVRAALGYYASRPDLCVRALTLVGAIGRFWTVRGYLVEGRNWIESLLACAPDEPSVARATACRTAGQIAYWQGDAAAGRRFGQESLAICRSLDDREGEIKSLFRLGFACLGDGDLECARADFEEALALLQASETPVGLPHLLNAVGEVAFAQGEFAEAHARFDEALAGFRQEADRRSIASVLKNLAGVAVEEGDHAAAFRSLAEGLQIRRELNNLPGVAATLDSFAVLAGAQGRSARAAVLLAAADALHQTCGSRPEAIEAPRIQATRATALNALGDRFAAHWSEGADASMETTVDLALSDGDPLADVGEERIETGPVRASPHP